MNPSFKTRTSNEALDEHLQQLKATTAQRKQHLNKLYAASKMPVQPTPPTPPPPPIEQMRVRSDSTATSIYVMGHNSTRRDPYASNSTTLDRKQEHRMSWVNIQRRVEGGGSISAGSRGGVSMAPPITPSPQTTRSYVSNITTNELMASNGVGRGAGIRDVGGGGGVGTISGRTTATSGRISSSGVTTISGSNNTLNDIHSDYHSQDVGAGSDFHNFSRIGVSPMKQHLSSVNGSFNLANGSTVKLLTATDDEANHQRNMPETSSTYKSDINDETISQNVHVKSLSADADQNDDKGEETEDGPTTVEQEAKNIPSKEVRLDVPQAEETLPTKIDWRRNIKHIVIVFILFVVWCIYTVSIITHKEGIYYQVLLVITSQEEKLFKLHAQPGTKNAIELELLGPFQVNQNVDVMPKEKQPHLKLQVIMDAGGDGKQKIISKERGLIIERPQELQYVVSVFMRLHVDLTEDVSKYEGKAELFLKLQTNIEKDLTVQLSCNMTPVDQGLGIIYGTFALLFLYILIIWEIINRTLASVVASLLGIGILAAMNERPTTGKILTWLDVETLMLLFGMMVLVSILSSSGIFDYMAVLAYELAKGNLFILIYILCFFTTILSTFLDNVTMMLLMTPVTIRLCEVTNLNPVPVLMSMVIYSNVGAALTPVGDPPNIIILTNNYVQNSGVNFANFILHMMPGVALGVITIFTYLYLKYPKIQSYMKKQSMEVEALKHEIQVWEKAAQNMQPSTTDEDIVLSTLLKKAQVLREKLVELEEKGKHVEVDYETTLQHMKTSYPIHNKALLIKSCIAFAFVIVLFCLHSVPNLQQLSLGWSALVGAMLLIILADTDIEALLSRVEWSTLLFFACLFILMEALAELGLIGALGELCINIILQTDSSKRLLVAILIILWITGIASAFLDNIPVTTMMIKIVISLCQNSELNLPLPPLVWALAFGACFGGNGTIIGASANVVASGVAAQHGYHIKFMDFFLFGFPLTLCTLVSATIYLYFAHCFWSWH